MPKMNCPCASATACKRKPFAGSTTVITAAAIRAPLISSTTPCSEVDPSWASLGGDRVRLRRTKSGAERWARRVHRLLRRGELHDGSLELHHRRTSDSYGHDLRRPGGR